MAGETTLTIIGNLTDAPELKFTPSGAAVANFTVASTPRTFDKTTNEWKDGEPLFMRCALWRQPGENAADSLSKGDRVIVVGALKQRSYEKDGQKRTVVELDVEEIGPSLKYATAKVTKAQRGGTAGGQQQGSQSRSQQNQGLNYGGWDQGRPSSAPPADSWGARADEAPPF